MTALSDERVGIEGVCFLNWARTRAVLVDDRSTGLSRLLERVRPAVSEMPRQPRSVGGNVTW